MKKTFLLLVVLIFAACSRQPMTIEEKVLMGSFTNFVTALVFDEVCNGTDPKDLYDTSQQKNVMLLGNQQMLAGRIGGLWHIRNPDKLIDEGVQKLLAVQDKIGARVRSDFETEGCETDFARKAAKAYELYSELHPATAMALIDKEIEKRGGKVTSLAEVETADKSSKAQ